MLVLQNSDEMLETIDPCDNNHEKAKVLFDVILFKTIQRAHRRLFGTSPPATILEEFKDYKSSQNQFSDEALLIQEHCELADNKKQSPNPLEVWRAMDDGGSLQKLASVYYRLFLTQLLLSAFSVFGVFLILILLQNEAFKLLLI